MSDTKTENQDALEPDTDATASGTDAPADGETSPGDANVAEDASATGDEAAAPADEPPPPEPTPEEQLASAQEATKAMKEKMLRVAADFENYRRRSQKEVDAARKRGLQTAVKDLLPVFDNLERATSHVDETTDLKSMVDGLNMVLRQLVDTLSKMGIERIQAVGAGFDPALHESIQYEHSSEHAAGIVMNELQPGYKQGDTLIRPAMVMVSRGPQPEPQPEPPAETAETPNDEDATSEAPAEEGADAPTQS